MLKDGADFSRFVVSRNILFEGPFTCLQVKNGTVWTLDAGGTLRRNGEPAAQGVAAFSLDGDGTNYIADGGLWRLADQDGSLLCLARGDFTAVAAGGSDLYYATAEGELRRVQVNGRRDTLLVAGLSVRQMQYFNHFERDGLCVTTRDGQVYLLFEDEHLFLAAEGAEWAQTDWHGSLLLLGYSDGSLQWRETSYSHERGVLFLDQKEICPEP